MKTGTGYAGALLRMISSLEAQNLRMHGLIVIRDRQTLAEGYYAPFQKGVPHRMFSVSKSMTSLAIGLLEAEEKLRLDDAICDYFPDKLPDKLSGKVRRLTLRDMLRMATCHRETTYKRSEDPDWTRSFFTVPPTHEPGMVFNYDTSASHTLAALAERLSGMPLLGFLQARLFDTVGAADPKRWLTDPVGVSQGGTGLMMTLQDLAKVAVLCLEGGAGTALEGYLRQATGKQIETLLQQKAEEQYGYGYQFWRVREGGFAMYGLGGQLALCLPKYNTVFCTIADTQLDPNGAQKIHDAFWRELAPHLTDTAVSAQSEQDALAEKLEALSMKPLDHTQGLACGLDREYVFDQNPAGFTYLTLKRGVLDYENAAGRCTLPYRIGGWAEATFPGTEQPCITSAGWIAPGLLRLQSHLTGDYPCGVDMLLRFQGDRLTVQMQSVRDLRTENYTGVASGRRIGS